MSYQPGPEDVRCLNAPCGTWYHRALPYCPMCDTPNTSSKERREEHRRAYEEEAQRIAEEQAKEQADKARAKQEAIYHHATGQGICPHCKSPNVVAYTEKEGGSTAGKAAAVVLGLTVTPLAFLAAPAFSKKKSLAYRCVACSNRWKL